MVLSQQCVQLSQFDSQLVNAQCSDSSVLYACACVCLRKKKKQPKKICMMKIPFFPPLISGFETSSRQLGLWSWRADQESFSFLLPHINSGVDRINFEDLFVKRNVYGLTIFFFFFSFSTDFIYKKLFFELSKCSKSLIVQDIYIYKYIQTYKYLYR